MGTLNFTFTGVKKPCFAMRAVCGHLPCMEKPPSSSGKLWLVGAGPGDPDLLTLRAARLLASADLVVHDGLVGDDVLALIPVHVERISVAKQRSRHTMKQEAINDLLVRETLAGKQVVRLKGGDPFIFGRGGEELDAARDAGVDCETVPGITAAMGCAAQAGLPLTHREDASALLAGASSPEFDAAKVERMKQAIADGSFKVNADVIADKLIANAQGAITASNWTTADARVLGPLEKMSYLEGDFIDRHGYFAGSVKGDASEWSIREGHTFSHRNCSRATT